MKAPKGTRDLFGREVDAFTRLEQTARRVFELYRFREIRTPIFESIDLFARSLGATSDVVEKEMFVFQDRGERTYALRPEGTAGVIRHLIEHNIGAQGGLHGLYYMGPMFRGERPQAGRYRQFWQIGSEYFGSPDASADADTVLIAAQIFQEFGLKNFVVHINSLGCSECRPAYRTALFEYLKGREADLTEESQRRMATNPLRVLDSKVDGPKLTDAPVMKDYLCESCKEHHARFCELLSGGTFAVQENPRLVRGLDYYVRSVFEFVSPDLGAQSALAAGGRYDGLIQSLGGPAMPGVGFALGMDRVVDAALKKDLESNRFFKQSLTAAVIPLNDDTVAPAFDMARQLRQAGISVAPVTARRKLKNQLSDASDNGIRWAVMIGEDEVKAGQVTIKNLATREQTKMALEDAVKKITTSC